jgi:hypothetical protein
MAGHGLLLDGPALRKWKRAIGKAADIDDVGALLGRLASKIGRGCAEIQNRLRPARMAVAARPSANAAGIANRTDRGREPVAQAK